MALITANDLETGLIPRRSFICRRWYHASNLWYYHRPEPAPQPRLDRRFYELIDDDIRDLCRHLHNHGIGTTPSCSGHFHAKAHFLEIWAELQHEADQIRTTGLVVEDCQTRQQLLFRNPSHKLPWGSFHEFRQDVRANQSGGYLGVIFRNDIDGIREQFSHDNLFERNAAYEAREPDAQGNWLLHIMVDASTPDALTLQWNLVDRHLRQLLHTAHRPAVVPLPGMLHP